MMPYGPTYGAPLTRMYQQDPNNYPGFDPHNVYNVNLYNHQLGPEYFTRTPDTYNVQRQVDIFCFAEDILVLNYLKLHVKVF